MDQISTPKVADTKLPVSAAPAAKAADAVVKATGTATEPSGLMDSLPLFSSASISGTQQFTGQTQRGWWTRQLVPFAGLILVAVLGIAVYWWLSGLLEGVSFPTLDGLQLAWDPSSVCQRSTGITPCGENWGEGEADLQCPAGRVCQTRPKEDPLVQELEQGGCACKAEGCGVCVVASTEGEPPPSCTRESDYTSFAAMPLVALHGYGDNGDCLPDRICRRTIGENDASDLRCRLSGESTTACTSGADCISNTCANGVCDSVDLMTVCGQDSDCPTGRVCHKNRCHLGPSDDGPVRCDLQPPQDKLGGVHCPEGLVCKSVINLLSVGPGEAPEAAPPSCQAPGGLGLGDACEDPIDAYVRSGTMPSLCGPGMHCLRGTCQRPVQPGEGCADPHTYCHDAPKTDPTTNPQNWESSVAFCGALGCEAPASRIDCRADTVGAERCMFAAAGEGEQCEASVRPCSAGLWCHRGTCAPPAAVGQPCGPVEQPCEAGLTCSAANRCVRAAGASCLADEECPLDCAQGRCRTLAVLGDACGADAVCTDGLVCGPSGVCQERATVGEECELDDHCASGVCGQASTCVNIVTDVGASCADPSTQQCAAALTCSSGRCKATIAAGGDCGDSLNTICEEPLQCQNGRCMIPLSGPCSGWGDPNCVAPGQCIDDQLDCEVVDCMGQQVGFHCSLPPGAECDPTENHCHLGYQAETQCRPDATSSLGGRCTLAPEAVCRPAAGTRGGRELGISGLDAQGDPADPYFAKLDEWEQTGVLACPPESTCRATYNLGACPEGDARACTMELGLLGVEGNQKPWLGVDFRPKGWMPEEEVTQALGKCAPSSAQLNLPEGADCERVPNNNRRPYQPNLTRTWKVGNAGITIQGMLGKPRPTWDDALEFWESVGDQEHWQCQEGLLCRPHPESATGKRCMRPGEAAVA